MFLGTGGGGPVILGAGFEAGVFLRAAVGVGFLLGLAPAPGAVKVPVLGAPAVAVSVVAMGLCSA